MVTAIEPYRPVDRAPDESWERRFRLVALGCLVGATAVIAAVVVGMAADVRWLTAGPRMWAVRPVTVPALVAGIVLCAGLWIVLFGAPRSVWWGRILLASVILGGVVWLALTVWLGVAPVNPAARYVPSSSTAFGMSAVAGAGLLQSTRRGAVGGQIMALLAGTIATIPLLGYLSGGRFLAGFPFGFGEIAIPTIGLVLLTAAATAFARPYAGLIAVAIANSPGGVVLRRLAVPVLLLPPVLVIAISTGELRPLRTLAWVGSILSVLGLVSLVALAHTLDRSDAERRRAVERAVAMAAGLAQDAEVVVRVGEGLGIVGSVPESVEVAVRRAPAEGMVGGDGYAVIAAPSGTIAVCLVDIASKGAEPSVAAVRLRDVVASALVSGASPGDALASARWLVEEADITATAFVAVVDPEGARLTYASAGHVPAFLRSLDGVVSVMHTGPLLHRDIEPHWEEAVIPFDDGASLTLYTDGIADVITPPSGGTSIDALAELLEECPRDDPEGIVEWCMRHLEASPEWVLRDDATLLVLRNRYLSAWEEPTESATESPGKEAEG